MTTCEIVRVLRLLEYVGPRDWVEKTMAGNAVKGEYRGPGFVIREAILGQFSELVPPIALQTAVEWNAMPSAPRDGQDVLLVTRNHGVVQGRFAGGAEGALWVGGDDILQIEAEETPMGWNDGEVLGWLPLAALPETPKEDFR